MAEIPSPIAASALQAGFQAREVGRERDAAQAGPAAAANRQVKSVDEAGTTVETADADARVSTDAEGSGSQGRAFGESEEQTDESPPQCSDSGIRRDPDGQLHLDLQA